MSLIVPKHVAVASARAARLVSADEKPSSLADEIAAPIPEGVPRGTWWRVVVTPIGLRSATKGGIQLATMTEEAQLWNHGLGRVVSIGSLAFKGAQWEGCDPTEIPKVGDLVLYNPKTPSRVRKDGKWYLTMNDDHVQSVVSPEHVDGYEFVGGVEV